jgi:SCP-2 sterol transfer family protein
MPEFPRAPVSPAELLERHLPAAFAASARGEAIAGVTVALGVRLDGEQGGEWVLELRDGALQVTRGSREHAAFTYAQSVADWRGAVWEQRGGAVGRAVAALFRPDAPEIDAALSFVSGEIPAVLEALAPMRGLVRVVVTDASGDWQVALQLGPGEIPEKPTTEVSVSLTDVNQMATGELNPIEAFMAGRIRLTGDMALMLQLQAAQMQVASARGAPRRG